MVLTEKHPQSTGEEGMLDAGDRGCGAIDWVRHPRDQPTALFILSAGALGSGKLLARDAGRIELRPTDGIAHDTQAAELMGRLLNDTTNGGDLAELGGGWRIDEWREARN